VGVREAEGLPVTAYQTPARKAKSDTGAGESRLVKRSGRVAEQGGKKKVAGRKEG